MSRIELLGKIRVRLDSWLEELAESVRGLIVTVELFNTGASQSEGNVLESKLVLNWVLPIVIT